MIDSRETLIYLAEKGALYDELELSTSEIANALRTSQQTVSRKIREMEDEGLLNREATPRGTRLAISQKGRDELKHLYSRLRAVFDKKKESFKGILESGVGEGAYYVSLKQYLGQFRKKLGIDPYKGTLNLRIEYSDFLRFRTTGKSIIIPGFTSQNRTFGNLIAYKIRIKGIKAAIIIPERTSHDKDTIEIISKTYFRKKLNLKDGQSVVLEADDGI